MLFRPTNTGKVTENIYAVRSFIGNFYVFSAKESLIVFDTGMSAALARSGMKKLELDPLSVHHVFLTHSDFDHVGGLKVFENAQVYLSEKEEPMVVGKRARMLVVYNKRLKNYKTLEDGQKVSVDGHEIKIISTPGHTLGSACYLIDEEILIAGDTLRISADGKFTPFLFIQNMNHSENKRSFSKLENEGIIDRVKLVLTGHTGYATPQLSASKQDC